MLSQYKEFPIELKLGEDKFKEIIETLISFEPIQKRTSNSCYSFRRKTG